MAVKTNAELAAFFQTGDQPSETEFGHLIDTIKPKHVTLTDADATLTVASHACTTLIVPNISNNREITLPAPTADANDVFPWFHLVYLPMTADGHNLTIATAVNGSQFFEGTINHSDPNDAEGGDAIHNDSNSDKVIVKSADYANLWFLGKSSTQWWVWGDVVGETLPTIENA